MEIESFENEVESDGELEKHDLTVFMIPLFEVTKTQATKETSSKKCLGEKLNVSRFIRLTFGDRREAFLTSNQGVCT
jgi:hypothetical protein